MESKDVNKGKITYISVAELHPHPDNPRKDVGDVTELAESIKANGILQNLTVVPGEQGYTVIIGHRRLAAAKLAGLEDVPCVVAEMSEKEQLSTMLTENMQRTDLTVYEQAQGFQLMMDLGDTVEDIAEKSGFSASTVRRRVKLLELDRDKFAASESRGATLKDYMELEKIDDPELKNKALDTIGTNNFGNVLKQCIENDKTKKRMSEWKEQLEAFATEIEERGKVGDEDVQMDYVRNYGKWSGDVAVEKPDDADTVKYYFLPGQTQIGLFKEHQAKDDDEDDVDEYSELREMWERAEEQLKEITERHRELRMEFVKEFGCGRMSTAEIAHFAAVAMLDSQTGVYSRPIKECIAELLGFWLGDDMSGDDYIREAEQRGARLAPENYLLICAYATLDRGTNDYYKSEWNSEKCGWQPCHRENARLDRLYDRLVSIGYQMSDEEKALRDGTHELFRVGEQGEEKEEDPCVGGDAR